MRFKNIRQMLFTVAAVFTFIGGVSAETVEERMETLFGEHEPYIAFYQEFKSAVVNEDQAAVAGMISYPLKVKTSEGKRVIKNKKELIAHYDEIFTEEVTEIITNQKKKDLFVNAQGVMFGNGEVWFSGLGTGEEDDPTTVKVIAINPETAE